MSSQPLSEVSSNFLKLTSRKEIANWLGVSDAKLRYLLYALSSDVRYTTFSISKRSGGLRDISAPVSLLKVIQKNLLKVFREIAPASGLATGFIQGKTILDHAKVHRNKRWIILVDLKEFFPSINFGRVRGAFRASPFLLNDEVATVLAKICCDDTCLPQGAPTSPVLSNLIARKLDKGLLIIARRAKCNVTRYADDICFSTNTSQPPAILVNILLGKTEPSEELRDLIEENGFEINPKKFKVIHTRDRQLVTGLTVNKNIAMPRSWRRQFRTILHLTKQHGEDVALEIILGWKKNRLRNTSTQNISAVIAGKGGFLSWVDSKTGTRHVDALFRSYPEQTSNLPRNKWLTEVRIMTEGITDADHFMSALNWYNGKDEYREFNLNFSNFPNENGDVQLLHRIKWLKNNNLGNFVVGIFDCDNMKVLKEAGISPGVFLDYSKKVYVMCLAPPPGFSETPFCIENLYVREEIVKEIDSGRRIFFADEFDKLTGLHKTGLYKRSYPAAKSILVSDAVIRVSDGTSVLLSKAEFATMTLSQTPPFNGLNFEGFRPTFDLLRKLVESAIRINEL